MRIEDVVSNVKVYGLEESIKRSKYPMAVDIEKLTGEPTKGTHSLASCEQGSGHDQFLTGIIVQFDLTFTNKAWVEAERYSFLDFVSSQSTMHRIAKFDLDKQYISYVDERMIKIMQELKDEYNRLAEEEDTEAAKEAYLKLLYSNPAGFRITAGMTTNYRQLKTIYYQRKNHRLPEWRVFCEWIETLPMFKELVLGEKNGKDKNVPTNDGWIPVEERLPTMEE